VPELTITAPDDGRVLGIVSSDDRASIDAKVRAAERAMSSWTTASPMRRAEMLLQIAAATREALPELADALSKEQGNDGEQGLTFRSRSGYLALRSFPWARFDRLNAQHAVPV